MVLMGHLWTSAGRTILSNIKMWRRLPYVEDTPRESSILDLVVTNREELMENMKVVSNWEVAITV